MYFCSIKSCEGVSITFDDGPSPSHTQEILDLLDQNNFKACFFLIGKRVQMHKEIVDEIDKRGHEIGNHTYSHINLKRTSNEMIKHEIYKCTQTIEKLTGKSPKFFRPPYGEINRKIEQIARSFGMDSVLWSVDSQDWRAQSTARTMGFEINKYLKAGSIVLLHDNCRNSIEGLKIAAEYIHQRGLRVVSLGEKLSLIKAAERRSVHGCRTAFYN